jgi:hypothetical protein
LLALFLKQFDALVKAVEVQLIVGGFLEIQEEGGRSRGLGIGGHLQFFGGGLLELGQEQGCGCDGDKQRKGAQEGCYPHVIFLE